MGDLDVFQKAEPLLPQRIYAPRERPISHTFDLEAHRRAKCQENKHRQFEKERAILGRMIDRLKKYD